MNTKAKIVHGSLMDLVIDRIDPLDEQDCRSVLETLKKEITNLLQDLGKTDEQVAANRWIRYGHRAIEAFEARHTNSTFDKELVRFQARFMLRECRCCLYEYAPEARNHFAAKRK